MPLPLKEGGAGSGNFGHSGRPGEVGGSTEGVSEQALSIAQAHAVANKVKAAGFCDAIANELTADLKSHGFQAEKVIGIFEPETERASWAPFWQDAKDEYFGHAWVVLDGKTILDAAASQFGGKPLEITSIDDTRYNEDPTAFDESNRPPKISGARKLTEADAQKMLLHIDKAMARLLFFARRNYIVSLEIQIAQYQRDLWRHTLDFMPKITGAVGNPAHMETVTTNLVAELERVGEQYAQVAANLGFERLLRDLQIAGWLHSYETPVIAPKPLLATALHENHNYLVGSLRPDLHKALKAKALRNLPTALDTFEHRIKLYGHFLWRVAERTYRLGAKDFFATVPRLRGAA